MLETGLPLPLFNIIKYFIVFTVFDIIVRISLDQLKTFVRSWRLNEGHSVLISSIPIDRHGLFSRKTKKFSFLSFVIAFFVMSTYVLEILLEFSSDSVVKQINVPGKLFLAPAEQEICEVKDISTADIAEHMIDFAHECIILDEDTDTYKIYEANWEVTDNTIFPSCVKTNENLLLNGSLPYNELTWISDDAAREDDNLSSLDSGPKSDKSVLIIQVSSSDVFFRKPFLNDRHVTGLYRTQIPNSQIACYGNIFGRIGEGLIKVENRICVRGSWPFNNDTDLIFFPATGVVYEDIGKVSTQDWIAPVVGTDFNGVKGLRKFARGVTSVKFSSIETYMGFLGLTNNRDHRSLQKYAILFHNCGLVKVPRLGATPRHEMVQNANSAPDIRVAVNEWSLAILVCWPILLFCGKLVLKFIMKGQSLPSNVQGEEDIGSLWFLDTFKGSHGTNNISEESYDEGSNVTTEDNSQSTCFWKSRGRQFYLSVDESERLDKIVVTTSPKTINRDKSKAFRSLE